MRIHFLRHLSKKYTESRSASPVDWHPLKREMLITTRFGNTSQLHYLKMPGGARTQITFSDEPVSNATFEPLKGTYFIFSTTCFLFPPLSYAGNFLLFFLVLLSPCSSYLFLLGTYGFLLLNSSASGPHASFVLCFIL